MNPKVKSPISPRSLVRLISEQEEWKLDRGRVFRIGYYGRQDGLDCVWLVNEAGEYEQTTDQQSINDDFEIIFVSDEEDLYGDHRERLHAI